MEAFSCNKNIGQQVAASSLYIHETISLFGLYWYLLE